MSSVRALVKGSVHLKCKKKYLMVLEQVDSQLLSFSFSTASEKLPVTSI